MAKLDSDKRVDYTGLEVEANQFDVLVAGGLHIAGVAVTSTAAELNILDTVTATAAELNYLDITTLGTGAASKAVVLDASGDYTYPASGTIVYPSGATLTLASGSTFNAAGTFQIGGTTVGASAAEIDLLDLSAQTETVIAAGVASVTKRVTNLDSSGGAGAFTLAAPDATMLGQVKIIQMTVAGNALTLALTNVQGGSAATTASFDAVDETLVLIAGTNKWTVLKEVGVTLS